MILSKVQFIQDFVLSGVQLKQISLSINKCYIWGEPERGVPFFFTFSNEILHLLLTLINELLYLLLTYINQGFV